MTITKTQTLVGMVGLVGAMLIALVIAIPAFAAPSVTLFGGATEAGGEVTLVSNTSDADPLNNYSGIEFGVEGDTTVAALTQLSTDYNVTDDDCAAGSPRFQLAIDTDGDSVSDGNVFVYLGPAPSFTGCTPNTWLSSGDLTDSVDSRFDLTQFGGAFYSTYADMIALLGDDEIVEINLVADSGWAFADGEQTVLIDNVEINEALYTFDPAPEVPLTKDDCKKGGWMKYSDPAFKNQGQCVASLVRSN